MQNQHPPAANRRKEPRARCASDVAIMSIDTEIGFVKAEIRDFSGFGMGLYVAEPLAVGEQFILKVKISRIATLLYAVRNCVRDGNGYRIGAEYEGIVGSPGDDPEQLRAQFIERLAAESRTAS